MKQIVDQFKEALEILQKFNTSENMEKIVAGGDILVSSFHSEGRVFSCGNGGSMCDAMHFAEELTGRYRNDRPAIGATAISDPSHIACVANDYGYEYVFSRCLVSGRKHSKIKIDSFEPILLFLLSSDAKASPIEKK